MTFTGVTTDLNPDFGKAPGSWKVGDDIALLDIMTNANIAYGYHADDANVMMKTCEATAARGIHIGAHVAYHDLTGFERRRTGYSHWELRAEAIYQVGVLSACAWVVGIEVSYIEPRGTLYNRIAADENQAATAVEAFLLVCSICGDGLIIMTQPGPVIERLSLDTDLLVIREASADRAYNPDGALVPRALEGSVVVEPDAVVKHAIVMTNGESTVVYGGSPLTVQADSICLHGDIPGAVELSCMIRQGFADAGVTAVAHV